MLVGNAVNGLLFNACGNQDRPLAFGKLAQGGGQHRHLRLAECHRRRVKMIGGFIHQRFHLGTGEHTAVGDALIGGSVERHPEQVRHRVALRFPDAHALDPKPGFLQCIQRKVIRSKAPSQTLAEAFIVIKEETA
ncbi:hypothetical protein D3C81_873450 [compost metagenome]